MVEEVNHGNQVFSFHTLHVDQGVGMFVPLQNIEKEWTRGDENHLVCLHLLTILTSQGHICEVFVLSQIRTI